MSKESILSYYGTVLDVLRDANFRVQIEEDENHSPVEQVVCICYLSGLMRKQRKRVSAGDKVLVEFSADSMNKGRVARKIMVTRNV
jgi:translation initiation factor IF-1